MKLSLFAARPEKFTLIPRDPNDGKMVVRPKVRKNFLLLQEVNDFFIVRPVFIETQSRQLLPKPLSLFLPETRGIFCLA